MSTTDPAVTRFATADVGTNTVLMLVVDVVDGAIKVVCDEAHITRLGEGAKASGALSKDAMARTLAVLSDFAAKAQSLGAHWLDAATTAAARDASNGRIFEMMARAVGVPVRIISGEEEAALSTLSVTAEPPPQSTTSNLVALDIGGGSTELVSCSEVGTHGGKIEHRVSFPIGSVRLTEEFVRGDRISAAELAALRAHIATTIAAAPVPPGVFAMVGLAGTVTSLAAMHLQLAKYDGAKVHHSELPTAEVEKWVARLAALSLTERQQITGLEPKRADVIVAGACIVAEVLKHYHRDRLFVSDRGLRWGLLRQALADAGVSTRSPTQSSPTHS